MEIKFDRVRIGSKRKNTVAETFILQNVKLLEWKIRDLFEDYRTNNKSNKINMIMIIPGRGTNIKVYLKDINDKEIAKRIKKHLPQSIFKGKYSVIEDNIGNKVF